MSKDMYGRDTFDWNIDDPNGRSGRLLTAKRKDTGETMLVIHDEDVKAMLTNALMQGIQRGRKEGRKEVSEEIEALLKRNT